MAHDRHGNNKYLTAKPKGSRQNPKHFGFCRDLQACDTGIIQVSWQAY